MTIDTSNDLAFQADINSVVSKFTTLSGTSGGKKDIACFNPATRGTVGRGPPRYCEDFAYLTKEGASAASSVTLSAALAVVPMMMMIMLV